MFSICHFEGEVFLFFFFLIFVQLNLGWDGIRPIGGRKPLYVPLCFLSFIYTYIVYVYTVHLYLHICMYIHNHIHLQCGFFNFLFSFIF